MVVELTHEEVDEGLEGLPEDAGYSGTLDEASGTLEEAGYSGTLEEATGYSETLEEASGTLDEAGYSGALEETDTTGYAGAEELTG